MYRHKSSEDLTDLVTSPRWDRAAIAMLVFMLFLLCVSQRWQDQRIGEARRSTQQWPDQREWVVYDRLTNGDYTVVMILDYDKRVALVRQSIPTGDIDRIVVDVPRAYLVLGRHIARPGRRT